MLVPLAPSQRRVHHRAGSRATVLQKRTQPNAMDKRPQRSSSCAGVAVFANPVVAQ